MKTYKAALAPGRMQVLHPNYIERAKAHIKKLENNSYGRRPQNEVTCPYCGAYDQLVATIRVGAKEHFPNVKLTTSGYELPEAGEREKEILIINCQADGCGQAINPLAYISPGWFYGDHECIDVFADKPIED